MIVRRERASDHDAVRTLVRAAFARDPATGTERAPEDVVEAGLLDELREDPGFLPHLSLVAVTDDEISGHVIATRGWLEPTGEPVLGLGPLGVLPGAQRRGIGTVLVHAVLAVAEAADESLVALVGEPAYYRRFDFRPATELGIAAPDPAWGGYFQARWLVEPRTGGTFRFAEPFTRH
ncbi:putative acetyltransferase [Blastococcus aggregatus]|uniref:Putative acetyltransferase n=1 Tax=Blastococcus aggregatus TaxID=38502 RepID=A0A285V9T4_9ACTN|nr:N-acetyltransferase [Blastococcus aggregatus]SOC50810.1 putative acetyltransferase [Blastococcus aggregatus]